MEEKRKSKKIVWIIGIIILLIVLIIAITFLTIFALKNKLTPEETVSKFMYLIENKDYEKAKKLCIEDLEKLEILSNIKPSSLIFEFSEDKKKASTVLLEDSEEVTMTTLSVNLENTIFGWKIKKYIVNTTFIPTSTLQERLESGKKLSEEEFIYWAVSEETSIEDIVKYTEDDFIILMLFSQFMEDGLYEKAMKFYEPLTSSTTYFTELSEEEIKEFNWADYSFVNSSESSPYIISDGKNKIVVIITFDNMIRNICKY